MARAPSRRMPDFASQVSQGASSDKRTTSDMGRSGGVLRAVDARVGAARRSRLKVVTYREAMDRSTLEYPQLGSSRVRTNRGSHYTLISPRPSRLRSTPPPLPPPERRRKRLSRFRSP